MNKLEWVEGGATTVTREYMWRNWAGQHYVSESAQDGTDIAEMYRDVTVRHGGRVLGQHPELGYPRYVQGEPVTTEVFEDGSNSAWVKIDRPN